MADEASSRLTAPQHSTLSASVTSEIGSPKKRKKIPLAPGHSLADWLRICRENPGLVKISCSSADNVISVDELSKHAHPSDCWIALRGKVYNVSPYLEFHPGGADEIMNYAGKDATTAFNEIHAWVNESLLKACCVGAYARNVKHTRTGAFPGNLVTNESLTNTENSTSNDDVHRGNGNRDT